MVVKDSITIEKIFDPKMQDKYKRKYLELLDVLDETGKTIGEAPRGLCHRLGLRHSTVYVMVVKENGKILLQQRGGGIDTTLGRLDIAVGGHIIAGEDAISSAYREMKEELGIRPQKERLLLIAEYNRDAPISIHKPLEMNRERRCLFVYSLTNEELATLSKLFETRESKGEVINIDWFTIDEMIEVVDKGKIADGLLTSFLHYMRWKYGHNND